MQIEITHFQDWMLPHIVKIEKASFTHPWNENLFRGEISSKDANFLVALSEGKVCGYCISRIVADECEIYNIAVDPVYRRSGTGMMLIGHTIKEASKQGVIKIHLEVRSSNFQAIGLYKKAGFEPVGLRRSYYDDPEDDAILMTLSLGE